MPRLRTQARAAPQSERHHCAMVSRSTRGRGRGDGSRRPRSGSSRSPGDGWPGEASTSPSRETPASATRAWTARVPSSQRQLGPPPVTAAAELLLVRDSRPPARGGTWTPGPKFAETRRIIGARARGKRSIARTGARARELQTSGRRRVVRASPDRARTTTRPRSRPV